MAAPDTQLLPLPIPLALRLPTDATKLDSGCHQNPQQSRHAPSVRGPNREKHMCLPCSWLRRFAVASLAALGISGALADQAQRSAGSRVISGSYVNYFEARQAAIAGVAKPAIKSIRRPGAHGSTTTEGQNVDDEGGRTLPLFRYDVRSSRDGQRHVGVIVGKNPFEGGTSNIPVQIIPVVLIINAIATSFDNNGNPITTPGHVVIDPRAVDNHCLSAPNNVPVEVLRQSPLFSPADFSFGGVFVGHTQYEDAFMRAAFFGATQGSQNGYHVMFQPVQTLRAVVLNVPPSEGVVATDPAILGGGFCAPLAVINIDWLDALINDQLLPALANEGVNPRTLPVFMLYATFMAEGPPGLFDCCIGGYHLFGGFPTPKQAYSVIDFDVTGIFGSFWPDSTIGSHELGEFINDPWGINQVPPWGGTGQVAGCQGNLEVGDPLTGLVNPVTMPNGFTYHLQELAFFSWFMGAPSLGVNGWFSNNGTFTTDAGTPCLLQ